MQPLLVLDEDLRVVSANPAFYTFFQVSPGDTESEFVYNLGSGQWDIPALQEMLETIIPRDTAVEDYEVTHEFPQIGRRQMLLNARRVTFESNRPSLILLAFEDVTD